MEVAVGIVEAQQHRPSRERPARAEMAGDVVRRHGVIAVATQPAHLLGEGRRRLAIARQVVRGRPRRCDDRAGWADDRSVRAPAPRPAEPQRRPTRHGGRSRARAAGRARSARCAARAPAPVRRGGGTARRGRARSARSARVPGQAWPTRSRRSPWRRRLRPSRSRCGPARPSGRKRAPTGDGRPAPGLPRAAWRRGQAHRGRRGRTEPPSRRSGRGHWASASSKRSRRRQSTLPWARQRSRARCKRGLGNVGGDELADTRRQQLGEPALRTGELHCLADRLVRQQAERAAILQLLVGRAVSPRILGAIDPFPVGAAVVSPMAAVGSAGLTGAAETARSAIVRPSAISAAMARSPDPAPPVTASAASLRAGLGKRAQAPDRDSAAPQLGHRHCQDPGGRHHRRACSQKAGRRTSPAGLQQFGQAHRIERQPHHVAGREATQGRRLAMTDDARAAAELHPHPVDAGIDGDRDEMGDVLADQQRAVDDQPLGQALRAEDLGLEGKAADAGQAGPTCRRARPRATGRRRGRRRQDRRAAVRRAGAGRRTPGPRRWSAGRARQDRRAGRAGPSAGQRRRRPGRHRPPRTTAHSRLAPSPSILPPDRRRRHDAQRGARRAGRRRTPVR